MNEAEALLDQVGTDTGEIAQNARMRLREKLRDARYRLEDLEAAAVERTRAAARATDDYVHEHPWRAVAVAAGLGFVVGLLVNRR